MRVMVAGMYYLTNIVLIGVALLVSTLVTNMWHRSNRKSDVPSCLRGVSYINITYNLH